MTNIEQLKKKTDEIKKWLEELKNNVSLSEVDKKNKAEELKAQAEAVKQKIENEILSLEDKTDDESKKKKEEAETLLNTFNETMKLYESILSSSENGTKKEKSENGQEEKWFLWKAWEWVWEQWDDVWDKEKWKTEAWTNALRTAWFIATWVWAVALAYKWIKNLWNRAFWDDEEEWEDEEKETKKKKKKKLKKENSRWKKFLIWAWITAWTVVGWVEIYKHWNKISAWFKEKLWLALPFDEAKQKVEAEIRNWKIDDNHFWAFNAHFDWITYDEQTQEICSYGQRTKVDKSSKKLQWLETEFPGREEMIHAANIVNFAKRMLRWRWASATPFGQTEWGWDLSFTCSESWKQEFLGMNNSNERSWILGTLWVTWWGILWAYCAWVHWAAIGWVWWWAWWYALWAYIDNSSSAWRCCSTIDRGVNFDLFVNYLNRQTDENGKSLRESAWEQHINPDDTPINWLVDNWGEWSEWSGILEELENSYWEDQSWRRNLKIDRNENKPEEYMICSYGHKLKLIIEWWPTKKWEEIDYSKIKNIHIEKYDEYDSWWDWLDIKFPHTKEWLKEAIKTANLTNMIVEDRKWKWWEDYPFFWWKYTTPPSLDMDTDWFRWKTILSRDSAKKFPTLFKDLKKWSDWWFWSTIWATNSHQTQMHDQAVHDKDEWSQYIKFLHQIGKWRFWKKVW